MSKAERMRSTPKWFNPCGHEVQSTNSTEPDEAIVMADAELVSPIINQAQIALSHATDFRENYVSIIRIYGMHGGIRRWNVRVGAAGEGRRRGFVWLPFVSIGYYWYGVH